MANNLSSIFFRISCIMEAVAIIAFTMTEIYAVPAFIIAKWVIVIFNYLIDKILFERYRKRNWSASENSSGDIE